MSSEFVPGNLVELLESGTEFFPLLRRSIDAAQHEIFVETYIFEHDDTGHMIAAALARAARRGVAVRVLVDGFGGRDFPRTLMPALLDSGAEVLIYRPEMGRLHMARHRLRRLHRKVSVIDARVAFVGGINIIDDMHTPRHTPPRYDYAVRVEGPLLASIHDSARKLWELVTWANFKRRYRLQQPLVPVTDWRGSMRAGFVVRDNLRHRRDIEDSYLQAIGAARDSILIANAYFLPGRRFRHALMEAAARGVNVTVLLQGRVEYVLLHYASQALYGALLDAGIRIFEYHRSFLHAKVAVVDEHWATVGSSNIDPFSLLMAREANVVVRDANFADSLRASLQRAMGNGSAQLHPADWKARSRLQRLLRWLAYGLVRAMIGLAGYGGKH